MGRFQYTGQAYIPELGMYHYKARIYSPTLGRFLQTDPIGYEDQVNLYAYVGNDPVNMIDPDGKQMSPVPPQIVSYQLCDGNAECVSKLRETEDTINGHTATAMTFAIPGGAILKIGGLALKTAGYVHKGVLGAGRLAGGSKAAMAARSNLLRTASKAKGNFGLGSATAKETRSLGKAWVGKGASRSKSGSSLVSKDGTRTLRISTKKNGDRVANFETRTKNERTGKWSVVGNGHLLVR